jgi:Transposase.
MLAAGKSVGEVLQSLEVSEATLSRWRSQYGGMKSEEAKRLKTLEEENNRLKKIVADQALDISMLKEITRGN